MFEPGSLFEIHGSINLQNGSVELMMLIAAVDEFRFILLKSFTNDILYISTEQLIREISRGWIKHVSQ